MNLTNIILEIRDPGPKFVKVTKNYPLEFLNILKANRKSILNSVPPNLDTASSSEILILCHKLNSIFDKHKSKFPCKIFFSNCDPRNWKSKGYSKILKNPCFNVCHFADKNSAFYEQNPHIVLEITKHFVDYLQKEDYITLQLNVAKGFGHEIIHYLQHYKMKEYSTDISSYYKDRTVVKRYSQSVEIENIDDLIKDWTSGKKTKPNLRSIFCRNYMCSSVELCPQAFSCFCDLLFYEKIKNPTATNDELKQSVIQSIQDEQVFKSRILKIFVNVAKDLQPRKFDQFKEMCLSFTNNDNLYDFVE